MSNLYTHAVAQPARPITLIADHFMLGIGKRGDLGKDSISSSAVKDGKATTATSKVIPLASPRKQPRDVQYLQVLAEAFEKVFNSIASAANTKIKGLVELQELDQTDSAIVLRDSTQAMQQESQQLQLVKRIQELQKQEEHTNEITQGLFSLGITPLLNAIGVHGLANTIISGVIMGSIALGVTLATGGAGAEAAAPLVEDIAAEVGGDALEMSDLSTVSDSSDIESSEESESTEGSSTSGSTTGTDTLQNAEQTAENRIKTLAKKYGMKAAKKLGGMIIYGIWGIPQIMQGATSLHISSYKNELAGTQKSVGRELAVLKTNNSYFKFYQELLQRGTSIAKELGNQMSEIVEVFGQVTNGYKQIANILASQQA